MHLHPCLYQVTIVAEFDAFPRARVLIRAANDADCQARLPRLVNDEEFRRQMTQAFVEYMFTSDSVRLVSSGALKVNDPAPENSPEWEFATPDGD
jgi:hypothetical protein